MADDTATTSPRTPRHLWLVGGLGFLWDGAGAYDYVMTQTRNEAYMGQFTPEQLDFFYGLPTWTVAFWALAVWGGVVGMLLVLLRKRVAVPVLLVSFVAMVVTFVHNFFLADGLEIMGTPGAVFSALIFLSSVGFWLYARAMAQRGVLR